MPNKPTNRTTQGLKEGPWVTYFANGSIRSEGRFSAGRKEGKWTLYHPNGIIKSEGNFRNGVYEGYYVSYHDNGNKFREGYYSEITGKSSDGRKEGVWNQFLRDGKTVEWEITYKRGRVVKRIEFPGKDTA